MPGAGVLFSAGGARYRWAVTTARNGNGVAGGGVNTLSQSSLSTPYVQTLITVQSASSYNPTSDTVQFAFPALTYPPASPTNWVTGSWVTYPGPAYWAQCLVGPAAGAGGTALSLGTYQVWVKITDSPEVPVLQPCLLTITP